MRIFGMVMNTSLIVLIIILAALTGACGDNNGDEISEVTIEIPKEKEDVVITIGNLTDMTGVAANPLAAINMALQDVVKYYNEENLIPGVRLETIEYDTQYDPARFTAGYEWVREKGADMIWTALPPGVTTLQSRAKNDKYPIFTATANVERQELQSGYVYCLAIAPESEAYTFLKWIAENDPDFPKDRPAKIGGAAWSDAYSDIWFRAAENYCDAHPEQYTWAKSYLTNFKFTWATEVEGLKDCDYIYIPTPPQSFIKEFRHAGYSAKFLGAETHASFAGMIGKAGLWDETDGMLCLLSAGWYNEDDEIMNLVNQLLDENHSEQEAEEIRNGGAAYRAVMRINMICEIIKETVERVGADNFETEALVNTANLWAFDYDDVRNFSNFSETKRFSQNYYAVFEVNVDSSNPHSWQYITRADPDWIPEIITP